MLAAALLLSAFLAVPQDPAPGRDLHALLAAQPDRFGRVLADVRGFRLQILLAEPVPGPDGGTVLRRSRLGDPRQYFYPASAIKLCGAIAALLELNRINAERGTAFGLGTALRIAPRFDGDVAVDRDPSNLDGGALTVGHDLRKLFLVSDNVAFNHCYELVGRQRLNQYLWDAGFPSCRIWHRLSEFRSPEQQRQTRSMRLQDGASELVVPGRECELALSNDAWTDLDVGTARMAGGQRVEGAMSFAGKNAILLEELQDALAAVVRPDIRTGRRGFPRLSVAQRAFLVQALGELPRESPNPVYPADRFPDHYVRFLLPGLRRVVPAEHLRVYDKIGRAYGFSVENAYVEDVRTGRGFFLAAVLYTNADGVLNDDEYEYETVADPFLADLGEVVARAVWGVAAGG